MNPIWYGVAAAIGGFIGPFIVPSTRIFSRRIQELESNLADTTWACKNAAMKCNILQDEVDMLKAIVHHLKSKEENEPSRTTS